jgi:hypothetical protein
MDYRKLKDVAVLVGYNPEGACVYSTALPLSDYWDGEHPWDSDTKIKKLRLEKVRGYLFGSDGELEQEFETVFDPKTGNFKSSWAKHADGTYQEHAV